MKAVDNNRFITENELKHNRIKKSYLYYQYLDVDRDCAVVDLLSVYGSHHRHNPTDGVNVEVCTILFWSHWTNMEHGVYMLAFLHIFSIDFIV